MSLSNDDIDRIANLARLALDDAERTRFGAQINGFFDIVGAMSAVDTANVEPLAHPVQAMRGDIELARRAATLRLRDDVASEAIDRGANMANAPMAERGLFLVPKVIE